MDGVLNIRKEKGFTSLDVVAKLSRNPPHEKDRSYRDTGPGCGGCASGCPRQSDQARRSIPTDKQQDLRGASAPRGWRLIHRI